MSITYTVDKFYSDDGDKVVGLLCTDADGNAFIIDKRVKLVDGTSNESYVKQAYDASKAEIDTWASQYDVKGKTFDPTDSSLSS
tara:strand:- start:610 stop:861 length:252 start_codon:yes stop_codon:yes gene_type:complete